VSHASETYTISSGSWLTCSRAALLCLLQGLGAAIVIKSSSGTDGLDILRARKEDLLTIYTLGAPVEGICRLRKLRSSFAPTAARRFSRGVTQASAKKPIAIIGVKPVNAGGGRGPYGGDCFVPSAGNLKIDFVLALQLDLAIIQPSR